MRWRRGQEPLDPKIGWRTLQPPVGRARRRRTPVLLCFLDLQGRRPRIRGRLLPRPTAVPNSPQPPPSSTPKHARMTTTRRRTRTGALARQRRTTQGPCFLPAGNGSLPCRDY